ncbi:MAG TPA: hypothetical protein VIM44_01965 [Rariglobus sp.]
MGMPTEELSGLLKRRLAVIADHAWRDRDPAGHLDALRGASEAIAAWTRAHRAEVDPQLRHFLANASYEKALAYVEKRSS